MSEDLRRRRAEFNSFVTLIVDLSMFWNGEDEERIPQLKTIRTLAGAYKDDMRIADLREYSEEGT